MSRGTRIDNDPEFLAWLELWISGEYEMSDLRSRYNDLVARRTPRSKSIAGALESVPSAAAIRNTD